MNQKTNEPMANYLPDQIVLLGDSIFDNSPYVNTGESVSEQLAELIQKEAMKTAAGVNSTTTQVELLAVDGHVLADLPGQIARARAKKHFKTQRAYLSCGGNDLLGYAASGLLEINVNNIGEALSSLHQVREHFRENYRHMLNVTLRKFPMLTICTIYDGVPNLSSSQAVALGIFNEVILREAAECQLPVLDLRVICNQVEDYSPISPIEPSKQGAAKIAQAILKQHNQYNHKIWEINQ
ncbi:SGNH/GDSL hydrolase family protein [Aeromonas fluvialis]|uniref:SGNH/GDSL hydrolase family protein n=1 Tax=Aeromonas fluvialis TaxID=591962 RepID=UPI000A00145D|nr:SGNH/GDSL hydrolase family protein [Aeromonas fluvialis]